jgi:general stress protein YciG
MPASSTNEQSNDEAKAKHRGFATMAPEKQREIASKGGKAAHAQGRAHEFSADEARTAGRKGGEAVSQNREHMAQIGREGGKARGRRHRERMMASVNPPLSGAVMTEGAGAAETAETKAG